MPLPKTDEGLRAIDLAWSAGIFEGEGSIMISKLGKRSLGALLVSVTNTDMEMITELQKLFGGRISGLRTSGGNRKDYRRWRIAAVQAATFLQSILPYLRTKKYRDRCELALQFQRQKLRTDWRNLPEAYGEWQQLCYDQMRALNQRGLEPRP